MDADRTATAWCFDRFTLDLARGALLGPAGDELPLRPKSKALLRLLVENAGRVVDRDAIMDAIWPDVVVTDESITQCVRDIRRALGDEGQRLLKTLPKRGYLLQAEVVRAGPTAAAFPRRGAGSHHPALAGAAALFAVVFLGGVWALWPADPGAVVEPSVAVLPFDNLGGDEATSRLADGVTEDIITDLGRFRDVKVIARNTTESYKGKAVDPRQLGRDLGVAYALEGSIQRAGERFRISAQLIATATRAHVWSGRWDRPAADVFAVQSEIAEEVAVRIGGYSGAVIADSREAAKRKRPRDLTAYDLYLLGVEAKHRATPESLAEALRLLHESLERDPTFSRAWTALVWTYELKAAWADPTPEDVRAKAEAGRKAVEYDPVDAEAHSAMAYVYAGSGDLARAEAEFARAFDLNPGSADLLRQYAYWAAAFGKPERGAQALDRAAGLDPNTPVWALSIAMQAYLMAGRYEDVLRAFDRKPPEAVTPDNWVYRAGSLGALGRKDEARAAVANALEGMPDLTIEGYVNAPWWSERERPLLIDPMRLAGFAPCAKPDELAELVRPVVLPECEAERAKLTAAKP